MRRSPKLRLGRRGGGPLPTPLAANGKELPWLPDVILWHGELVNETPWRRRADLAKYVHSAEFPDDVQVTIRRPETNEWEIVWVRVVGYHPRTGEYLAQLLNEPHAVPSLSDGDNLVFRVLGDATHPAAIDRGNGYALAAYSEFGPSTFADAMHLPLHKQSRR
ncbi:hypothetical protein N8077_06115 [Myxococcota bacterium]|nr:hypothetical protein [Myxococcota bacterium]